MHKPVWVECGLDGSPIRIFKNAKQAANADAFGAVRECEYAEAVTSIRRKVFVFADYKCQNPDCRKPVTWDSGELHEKVWKGRLGQVSIWNSICLCSSCHKYSELGHCSRQLQFTSKTQRDVL